MNDIIPPGEDFSFTFQVECEPVPTHRRTAAPSNRRGRVMSYIADPTGKTTLLRQKVELLARQACGGRTALGPVRLEILYLFAPPRTVPKIPKGHTTAPHADHPDLDNLEKSVMDAITKSGLWKDDRQVSNKHTAKRWHATAEPQLVITVSRDEVEEGPGPSAIGPGRDAHRATRSEPGPGAQGPGPTASDPSSWPRLDSDPNTSLLIMEAAAEAIGHGVTVSDMLGNGRMPDIRHARLIAAYLMRHHQHLSFPEIAQRMNRGSARGGGNTGHSGCLGLVRTGQSMLDAGGEVAALFLSRLNYTYSTVRSVQR